MAFWGVHGNAQMSVCCAARKRGSDATDAKPSDIRRCVYLRTEVSGVKFFVRAIVQAARHRFGSQVGIVDRSLSLRSGHDLV